MRYLSEDQLPAVTQSADAVQALLDRAIADAQALPADTPLPFRIHTLDQLTTILYRLAGVRKTLAALRAGFKYNTAALQELNNTLRALHTHITNLGGELHDNTKFPTPPKSPWAPKKFAPNWPPALDELIPEPTLPEGGHSCPPFPANVQTTPTPQANNATPNHNSSPRPSTPLPNISGEPVLDPTNPNLPEYPVNSLNFLTNRLPLSLTSPNHKLPPESNTPTPYAPMYNLDLLSNTPTIPTLPMNAQLPTALQTKLTNLSDAAINLRADILYTHPNNPDQSDPSDQSDPPDQFTPPDDSTLPDYNQPAPPPETLHPT